MGVIPNSSIATFYPNLGGWFILEKHYLFLDGIYINCVTGLLGEGICVHIGMSYYSRGTRPLPIIWEIDSSNNGNCSPTVFF